MMRQRCDSKRWIPAKARCAGSLRRFDSLDCCEGSIEAKANVAEGSPLATVLQPAGWLPPSTESEPLDAALGEDLLPRIQDRWEQTLRDAPGSVSGRRSAEWIAWLSGERSQGASLTWGFPGLRGPDAERWLGA